MSLRLLDIKGKVELLGILKQLAREQNMAVLLSLHELDLARKFRTKWSASRPRLFPVC